jgi:hypothetical protein
MPMVAVGCGVSVTLPGDRVYRYIIDIAAAIMDSEKVPPGMVSVWNGKRKLDWFTPITRVNWRKGIIRFEVIVDERTVETNLLHTLDDMADLLYGRDGVVYIREGVGNEILLGNCRARTGVVVCCDPDKREGLRKVIGTDYLYKVPIYVI